MTDRHGCRFTVSVTALLAFLLACSIPIAGAQGVPGSDPNKCLAGKTKCVSTKVKGLLKCREKCQKNPIKCGQVQTDCEAKALAKFDGGAVPEKGCFAKLEAKANPSKPSSICTTTGDTATMEVQADALVAEVLASLEGSPAPAPTCASLGMTTGFMCEACLPFPTAPAENYCVPDPFNCDLSCLFSGFLQCCLNVP